MKIHETANYLLNATHPITISLIGCGGTGSLMLSRLARLDFALKQFGKPGLLITVFDDDIVEEHNIGRQMFAIDDVGEYKAFTLVSKINRNFLTNHIAVNQKFNCNKNYNANIFITAVDNANFRIQFDKFFKKKNNKNSYTNSFYWMDFGNAKNVGQCILGSLEIKQKNENKIKQLKSVIDLFPNIDTLDTVEIQGENCSYQSKLMKQNLFINDSITALGSHLLWELLIQGYVDKNGFFLNLNTLKSNPIKL